MQLIKSFMRLLLSIQKQKLGTFNIMTISETESE